jgi:HAMP domain-containing protein
MIRKAFAVQPPPREPERGQPVISGEEWLGRKPGAQEGSKKRLWDRLSLLHRKQLRLLARAFVLRQSQARLPEPLRGRFIAAIEEIERLAGRVERLLAELNVWRTPPGM